MRTSSRSTRTLVPGGAQPCAIDCLRDRLNDGCGAATLPPNGQPGGCSGDAGLGVDPATNQLPAGRVIDASSFSPVVAPDGHSLRGLHALQLCSWADLKPEWSYQNTNMQSCTRAGDGNVNCVSDHPNGFEWCINAPVVDANGTPDGKIYAQNCGHLFVAGN